MPFYTEKEIEAWLDTETKDLPFPDGTCKPVTAFQLVWGKAESLVLLDGYSIEELVRYAVEESTLQRIDIDRAFASIVAWLDNQRRSRWGISPWGV